MTNTKARIEILELKDRIRDLEADVAYRDTLLEEKQAIIQDQANKIDKARAALAPALNISWAGAPGSVLVAG